MRASSAIRNIKLRHGLIAASIFVAVTSCVSINSVQAEPVPLQPARYLPAVVASAPDVPLPEKQRVPFGWKVATIPPSGRAALVLKWNAFPADAKPMHFRITVGLDERDEKEVEVTLPGSGRRLGLIAVRYPAQFQLYELELSPQDVADVVREGLALRLTKGSELEIFVGGDSLPQEFHPHLVCSGNSQPMEEFFLRMQSLASVQQFGWMEGCVLEGLLDLGELPDGKAFHAAAEGHLSLFLRKGKLIYESPHSAPSDGRIYGIEATLPFAAIARLHPEHPFLQLAVESWGTRRHSSGSIQDGSMMTSEGTYTVAYPMALIAKARGDEALMLDALRQCRLRTGLFDGKEFWRTRDDAGVRHDRNWARGIAWQLLGLVRTLEVAKDRDDIGDLIEYVQALSRWVMQHQREDGLWSVIITEPGLSADTSGCAGIAAALARAARQGWLDPDARDSALRARAALHQYLTSDGFLKGASQSNKGGLEIQRSDYRVIFQMGMGLYAQLIAATMNEQEMQGFTSSVNLE